MLTIDGNTFRWKGEVVGYFTPPQHLDSLVREVVNIDGPEESEFNDTACEVITKLGELLGNPNDKPDKESAVYNALDELVISIVHSGHAHSKIAENYLTLCEKIETHGFEIDSAAMYNAVKNASGIVAKMNR